MATPSSVLAWKPRGQRSLTGCSPWGPKQLDTTEPLSNNRSNSYLQQRLMVPQVSILPLLFILKYFYLFIWLCWALVEACGVQVPEQGLNPGPCVWSTRSQPLDHQGGVPLPFLFAPVFQLCICPPRLKAYFSGSFATRYGHLTKAGK